MLKVLRAYVRKSIYEEGTSDDYAVQRQRHSIEQWARFHGPFRIVWYEDLDISGKTEANRDDWNRLVSELDQNTDHGVIVEDYDRSHRNTREALAFYDDILAPLGLRYISTQLDIDISTADGRAWFINRMNWAELESNKARERMKRTVKFKVEKLGRHWGRNPFGCDRDEKTKHIIPSKKVYFYNPETDEAIKGEGEYPELAEGLDGWEVRYYYDALQAVYGIYQAGNQSLNDVANLANRAGWRHWSHGGVPVKFNRISVHKILRSWRLYAGELPPGYQSRHKRGSFPGGHQPILPVELCHRVGEVILDRHVVRVAESSQATIYLLSGILRCGHCQNRLTGQTMNRVYRYYRHSDTKTEGCPERMVKCDVIDQIITDALMEMVGIQSLIEDVTSKVRIALTLAAGNDTVANKLHLKQDQLERLIDAYQFGYISKEQFIARSEPLKAEIAETERQITSFGITSNLEYQVMRVMSNLTRLPEASAQIRRKIVMSVVSKIMVKGGQITEIVPTAEAMPLFFVCKALPKLEIEQNLARPAILQYISLPAELSDLF